MSSIEIINRTSILFEANEVKGLNLNGGNYSASFTVETTDGKIFEFKFTNTSELLKFIELVSTAAINMQWGGSYPSERARMNDDNIKISRIVEWREAFDSIHEDDPMTYLPTPPVGS